MLNSVLWVIKMLWFLGLKNRLSLNGLQSFGVLFQLQNQPYCCLTTLKKDLKISCFTWWNLKTTWGKLTNKLDSTHHQESRISNLIEKYLTSTFYACRGLVMSEKQTGERQINAVNTLATLSWVPGLYLESSGSLLWLTKQRANCIWLESRNSDEQRERGRNSVHCWSMSLARRFVCLILSASVRVLQFTLFFFFWWTPTDWI